MKRALRLFIAGLGSLGNFAGDITFVRREIHVHGADREPFVRDDREALRNDWRAVGRDLYDAMGRTETPENEHDALEPA